MEICSKGTPTVDHKQLENDYPRDSVKCHGQNENEYPVPFGTTLFW